MELLTKDVSIYLKTTRHIKNGRYYRNFEEEKAGLQLQQFTVQKSAMEHSVQNKNIILNRCADLAIPTVIIAYDVLQFIGNNNVTADHIMTTEQLNAFDTSENHWGRSTWRSEVSDNSHESLELNLNYENHVVLPNEQGFYQYTDGKYVKIKNRHKQIQTLWDYGFPSKRGRPVRVGKVAHSGTKTEVLALVDWLERLRTINSGSEIKYKTQQIYNTLNRHYAWPEHW